MIGKSEQMLLEGLDEIGLTLQFEDATPRTRRVIRTWRPRRRDSDDGPSGYPSERINLMLDRRPTDRGTPAR